MYSSEHMLRAKMDSLMQASFHPSGNVMIFYWVILYFIFPANWWDCKLIILWVPSSLQARVVLLLLFSFFSMSLYILLEIYDIIDALQETSIVLSFQWMDFQVLVLLRLLKLICWLLIWWKVFFPWLYVNYHFHWWVGCKY